MANLPRPSASEGTPANQPRVAPPHSPFASFGPTGTGPAVSPAVASSIVPPFYSPTIPNYAGTSLKLSKDEDEGEDNDEDDPCKCSFVEALSKADADSFTMLDIWPITRSTALCPVNPSKITPEYLSDLIDDPPKSHIIQFCLFLRDNKCIRVQGHIAEFNALLTKLGYNDPRIPPPVRTELRNAARKRILHLGQKMEECRAIRVTNRRRQKVKHDISEAMREVLEIWAQSYEEPEPPETVEFAIWTEDWDCYRWDGDLKCPWGLPRLVNYFRDPENPFARVEEKVEKEVFFVGS